MKTKCFFIFKFFPPLPFSGHPFVLPKTKRLVRFFSSEFWLLSPLRQLINNVLYRKPLKIITAIVRTHCARIMKNNSAVPHALLVVFVINELWRFGVNDPYHIELSFFIADNWRWLRSRASVRLYLIGNFLSLMSNVDLYYLMKLGPQWNGFYYTEWADWALSHFDVFLTSPHP